MQPPSWCKVGCCTGQYCQAQLDGQVLPCLGHAFHFNKRRKCPRSSSSSSSSSPGLLQAPLHASPGSAQCPVKANTVRFQAPGFQTPENTRLVTGKKNPKPSKILHARSWHHQKQTARVLQGLGANAQNTKEHTHRASACRAVFCLAALVQALTPGAGSLHQGSVSGFCINHQPSPRRRRAKWRYCAFAGFCGVFIIKKPELSGL